MSRTVPRSRARPSNGTPHEFGLTTRTLCVLLREAGVEPNRPFARHPPREPLPADTAAAAYTGGASIRQVAGQLGRSYGSVYRVLSEHPGVRMRRRGSPVVG